MAATTTISITFPTDAMPGILEAFSGDKPVDVTPVDHLTRKVLGFVADTWKRHAENAAFVAASAAIQQQIDSRATEVVEATVVEVSESVEEPNTP
jgi:L-asparaginase II